MGVIVMDRFNRPDSATTLGTAESGQPWIHVSGKFGISNGQAYGPDTTTGVVTTAYVDSGVADNYTLAATMTVEGNGGIAYRVIDNGNYFLATTSGLYRMTGGVNSLLVSYTSLVSGDRVSVVVAGPNMIVYRNGNVQLTAINDTSFQTATGVGLGVYTAGVTKWDDLVMTSNGVGSYGLTGGGYG